MNNVLEKKTYVTYIAGSPAIAGYAGRPYIPAHYEYYTENVCAFFPDTTTRPQLGYDAGGGTSTSGGGSSTSGGGSGYMVVGNGPLSDYAAYQEQYGYGRVAAVYNGYEYTFAVYLY